MSNGASVESLECCLHTRSIQEYTEARSSTRVDGAQSFRPWLVSNLACPAYRNPGITADTSQFTKSIQTLFLTSSQALNNIIASLVYLGWNLIDFCLDIKHDVAHVLDPCTQHLLVEYPRIEIPRLQYKKTCSQRAVIMSGLVWVYEDNQAVQLTWRFIISHVIFCIYPLSCSATLSAFQNFHGPERFDSCSASSRTSCTFLK